MCTRCLVKIVQGFATRGQQNAHEDDVVYTHVSGTTMTTMQRRRSMTTYYNTNDIN